jgi:polysaccharide biosynthesis protein PslG
MKRIITLALILLCGSVCQSAQIGVNGKLVSSTNGIKSDFSQSGIPPKVSKFGLTGQLCGGVNIHFVTGHEKDLDLIASAGFKFIRMDFGWQGTERVKGTYNWTAFDELTANLEKRGLGAIYIFDYSNSLYEESTIAKDPITGKEQKSTASPQHEESIAAFARWAVAAALHYTGKNIIWEIWNEPNISFWKPKPDVAQYTALALATCKVVKTAVPGATIIGPASSETPWPFLEKFLSSGVLEYLDAVSIHPYRNYSKSPETAATDYKKLRELIEHYAPEGKKQMPIISSEWGYSTALKANSLDAQAANIVRMQLSNLMCGVPISIWYDWKNDGTDPNDWEQNFGTVTNDLVPKPSYNAVKLMNTQLKGYAFMQRIDLKNDHDYALLFKNDKGNYKICAWTVDIEHAATIESTISKVKNVTITDGTGNAMNPRIAQDKLVLDLKILPQYVTLPRGISQK